MKVIDLGITDYLEAYEIQMGLVKEVSAGISEDTLLITEHRPVITIGRKGSWDSILRSKEELFSRGIDVFNIDRGGDVTYHSPGQIVSYPIFRLIDEARDIHNFLDFLEAVGKSFLMQYGIISEDRPGDRGLWVEGKKIGSIGIGVKKWVTYHGIAINIDPDMAPFSFIKPCGMESVKVTSLRDVLCREIDLEDAKSKLELSFKKVSLLASAVSSN
ncbi:MAG: lipoyl(octanoyl) transferase LipB [Candidatus Omnitrophica bacterium]|nr:lipoyl(octanoyl) transferase LipB [Candidatus Omnitrophota bacterium]MBU1853473.1 lipoyl(octanoyl) transferase LipB [Candidatus Omnitrophota bacterium]